jgi:hypothetical protein
MSRGFLSMTARSWRVCHANYLQFEQPDRGHVLGGSCTVQWPGAPSAASLLPFKAPTWGLYLFHVNLRRTMKVLGQMRTRIVGAGLAIFVTVATTEGVSAADLSIEPVKRVVKIRKAMRAFPVVRDYDGTPIYLRPYRTVSAVGANGAVAARVEYEAVPVVATPSRGINGQPVLPHHPRGWPREATSRYRIMAGLP